MINTIDELSDGDDVPVNHLGLKSQLSLPPRDPLAQRSLLSVMQHSNKAGYVVLVEPLAGMDRKRPSVVRSPRAILDILSRVGNC